MASLRPAIWIILLLLLPNGTGWAQEVINLAFYNVLNYPEAPPENREEILADIVDAMQPDLFMICELESEAAGIDILDNSLNSVNDVFNVAPYQNNTSSTSDLQQLLYYNRNKFELVLTDIIQTTVRDINRYRLKLKTIDQGTNPQFLEVFIAHLKASQGGQNELLRLDMVENFTDYLETLDPDDALIFAGDLNVYTSEEPAYQELLNSSNDIVLLDPIDSPGDWNSNSAFGFLHTQSTRISNDEFDDFGAGGGLDSRFDFILLSQGMFDDTADIRYIDNSYVAFGNNENCYNDRIDDASCGGFYSQGLRNLLYQMSDHLPVIAQIETSEQFLNVATVIQEPLMWIVNTNVVDTALEIAFAKAQLEPSSTQPFGSLLVLYDQTGRVISRHEIRSDRLQINTEKLADGLYYLTYYGATQKTLKFIKSH